jgi:RNA polymerase sigma-70 factor (ECF subfamily)
MVELNELDTAVLIRRAARGDRQAVDGLMARHRDRLRRMVAIRMDQRVAGRVDASDIVQEALADASQKLPDYLQQPPLPFYPWLRQIAFERLIAEHRRHVEAKVRSVTREEPGQMALPDHSAVQLAACLLGTGTSPSVQMIHQERRGKVQQMLAQMSEMDREVLVLRYLEQLSTAETAAVLGLTVNGVKSRQRRALERFSNLMADHSQGDFQ